MARYGVWKERRDSFPGILSHLGGFMRYISVHFKNDTKITHARAKVIFNDTFLTVQTDTADYMVPVDNILFIFLGKEIDE